MVVPSKMPARKVSCSTPSTRQGHVRPYRSGPQGILQGPNVLFLHTGGSPALYATCLPSVPNRLY
ncbi:MAG: hypothetical protein ACLSTO_08685 [Bilophila wadsworthia]